MYGNHFKTLTNSCLQSFNFLLEQVQIFLTKPLLVSLTFSLLKKLKYLWQYHTRKYWSITDMSEIDTKFQKLATSAAFFSPAQS